MNGIGRASHSASTVLAPCLSGALPVPAWRKVSIRPRGQNGSLLGTHAARDIRATFQGQLWGLKQVRTNEFALGVSNEKRDLYPQVRGE